MTTSWLRPMAGHLWTVLPAFLDMLRPPGLAGGTPFDARISDPVVGEVTIRAVHHELAGADSLIAIVHGIGGNADSAYCVDAARAAVAAGCSAVRISLRGADGNGDDIYHAGLTDDLKALLSARCLRRYRRVFLFGYSLGGNIALRAAADRIDPRLAGVVAICPPLDLRAAMENFDRKRFWLHKKFMNGRANRQYAAVERRGRAHTAVRQLRRARSSAEWNGLTIVPRFRFRDVNHYYEATGMAGSWHQLQVPVLIAASRYDPVVPCGPVRRKLVHAPANVQVEWLDAGGHIYFPRNTDLGERTALGLEHQCVAWLIRNDCSAGQARQAV